MKENENHVQETAHGEERELANAPEGPGEEAGEKRGREEKLGEVGEIPVLALPRHWGRECAQAYVVGVPCHPASWWLRQGGGGIHMAQERLPELPHACNGFLAQRRVYHKG